MKDISSSDFHVRLTAVLKARKIFVPHITQNITIAFDLYREILVEDDLRREEFMNTYLNNIKMGFSPLSPLDDDKRLICPHCKIKMGLRVVSVPKDPKLNIHGWRSCWECIRCGYEEYSTKAVSEWLIE